MIYYDKGFDSPCKNGLVFQIFPDVFGDDRGNFSEVLKQDDFDADQLGTSWIKQINRSVSKGGTIRGCHAQCGPYCQGKLVEALTAKIYDIITDARPDSKTFGVSNVYVLDPVQQNKLWVPRGFLHAFVVPSNVNNAVFQYFCDNVYNKASEIQINPLTVIPHLLKLLNYTTDDEKFNDLYEVFSNELTLSDKDKNAQNYSEWMKSIEEAYNSEKKVWYR